MDRGSKQHRTTFLISTVGIGGAAALVVLTLVFPPHSADGLLQRALVLLALTALAELIQIPVHHGESGELLTLFELAVVADMVLLPPAIAAYVAIGGLALSLLIQRRPPVKFAFNCGQYALGLVPAIVLYHTLGHANFGSNAGLLAILAGMAIFTASNLLTISAIIAVTTERSMRAILAEERGISFALGLGNAAVGMVAVSLYLTRPALLPAVIAPTLALRQAFKGWVKEKELSRQMREESEKLGHILANSSEGIVLADAKDQVLVWSPAMARATGVSAEEAVGKALPYLLRGRNTYGRSVSVGVQKEAEAVEIEIIAADGSPRWLRVQHGPGFDEHGELSFDALLVTDVTRQREVERLKDDFFSTVSHELRTPLTPIKGYASLLLRRGDDIPPDRRREALQSIVERADHMARLVEDMLLASRIANAAERRLPEVSRQVVEVGALAEKAVRSFRTAHPTREFVVRCGDNGAAMGDPIRVEQVVANLVSNAVKFSEDGTTVDVDVNADGGEIVLQVRDEGRGIPSDKFEEIFQKFKRIEDPLVMETGGAGLGLFIVQQLAAAMGGSVSVQSELGHGSTFTVRLPVAGSLAASPPNRRASDVG